MKYTIINGWTDAMENDLITTGESTRCLFRKRRKPFSLSLRRGWIQVGEDELSARDARLGSKRELSHLLIDRQECLFLTLNPTHHQFCSLRPAQSAGLFLLRID